MIVDRTKIDFHDFEKLRSDEERLKYLVMLASLAPSAHNSQPWQFRIGGGGIELWGNRNRLLEESDPDQREFFLSLGAAAGNLELAMSAVGVDCDVDYFPDTKEKFLVCRIRPVSLGGRGIDADLFTALVHRENNREPYGLDDQLDRATQTIEKICSGEPELEIRFVRDPGERNKVTEVVLASIVEAFKDKKFSSELSRWFRSSLKKHQDGMVGYNLGIPWIMSFIFPWLVRNVDTSKKQREIHEKMLKACSCFVVLASDYDNPKGWVRIGRLFDKLAVELTRQGIKTSLIAAPIEIGDHHRKLRELLGLHHRPQMFFRIGRSNVVRPFSPRLNLEEILINE